MPSIRLDCVESAKIIRTKTNDKCYKQFSGGAQCQRLSLSIDSSTLICTWSTNEILMCSAQLCLCMFEFQYRPLSVMLWSRTAKMISRRNRICRPQCCQQQKKIPFAFVYIEFIYFGVQRSSTAHETETRMCSSNINRNILFCVRSIGYASIWRQTYNDHLISYHGTTDRTFFSDRMACHTWHTYFWNGFNLFV